MKTILFYSTASFSYLMMWMKTWTGNQGYGQKRCERPSKYLYFWIIRLNMVMFSRWKNVHEIHMSWQGLLLAYMTFFSLEAIHMENGFCMKTNIPTFKQWPCQLIRNVPLHCTVWTLIQTYSGQVSKEQKWYCDWKFILDWGKDGWHPTMSI